MMNWGSLVGLGLNAVGSIYGGIKNAKAAREVMDNLKRQRQDNQAWYDRRYNENATQRADAQRLLTMTEESIRNRNKQAAGAAAVMGGTEESVAAAKAANSRALADIVSDINARGEMRKDKIEQTYLKNDTALQQDINKAKKDTAAQTAKAVSGVADAAGSIINAF